MQRESLMPEASVDWELESQALFRRHFEARDEVERNIYGNINCKMFESIPNKLFVEPSQLNSSTTVEFVRELDVDACFIFGVDLILGELLSILPEWKINLHLGLSPWYRGSATLFWPFYFLQPQYAGATFHQIEPEADAGEIIHHSMPNLELGQSLHDVAAEVVVNAKSDLVHLYRQLDQRGRLELYPQKSTGRLFLTRDFEPHHLRLIYDLYKDRIVDEWINGRLGSRKPKIYNGIK
jgi:methionyl-tRNA formyltransferase